MLGVGVNSDRFILRPPIQPEKYSLNLQVLLKWRDHYIEDIIVVLLMAGL